MQTARYLFVGAGVRADSDTISAVSRILYLAQDPNLGGINLNTSNYMVPLFLIKNIRIMVCFSTLYMTACPNDTHPPFTSLYPKSDTVTVY